MTDIPRPGDRLPRFLEVQALDPDSGDRGEHHRLRRWGVIKRRQYFEGQQYVQENEAAIDKAKKEDASFDPTFQRLPEHFRIHAYSDHVSEAVNFLADQITGQMVVRPEDDRVGEWIESFTERSKMTHRRQEMARETLIAGDLFINVLMARTGDDDEAQALMHMWEAETVEVDYDDDDWSRMVEVRTEEKRILPDLDGNLTERRYIQVWRLESTPFLVGDGLPIEPLIEDDEGLLFRMDGTQVGVEAATFLPECVKIVRVDDEERERRRLGIPFLPWVHVHGEQVSLRTMYGRSVITFQVMETVDRYNAVNQLEFLAVRYNSFGTLGVVGDEAYLREQQGEGVFTVHKDVADVVVVPGGTNLVPITLNINVEAYAAQKDVLIDALFGLLGLARIDPEKISSFGGVSGYALEILNRMTDGTFRRVVENQKEAWEALFEMALTVDAIARADVNQEGIVEWWNVNVDDVWPNRQVEVDFGTAYIVDEVAVRDDFVSDLISRREALRRRGRNDEEIDQIVAEIEDEQVSAEGRLNVAIEQGTRFSTERG